MKKVIITLVLSIVAVTMYAQTTASAAQKPQRLKYITKAPDGTVAMTIYDDSREESIKLESANSFYKYIILDPTTGKLIHTAANTGKECTIDKSKLGTGTYDIRLYTTNFVVASKLTVSATRKLSTAIKGDAVAMNE
tara:strand:+ start:270 stop:680 length:411 start_codon:yes stop_codon:yes gene_type:complete